MSELHFWTHLIAIMCLKGVNNLQADSADTQVFSCADDNKTEKKDCNNSDWFSLQKILIICVW